MIVLVYGDLAVLGDCELASSHAMYGCYDICEEAVARNNPIVKQNLSDGTERQLYCCIWLISGCPGQTDNSVRFLQSVGLGVYKDVLAVEAALRCVHSSQNYY